MKLAIFATGRAGLGIVESFCNAKGKLACLLTDPADPYAERIREAGATAKAFLDRYDIATPVGMDTLRKAAPDLGLLAWWPDIVSARVIGLFPKGMLNTHPSLLPHNRGRHYYFWSLVEDAPFGVSIHWVDERIDHGDIAWQKEVATSWEQRGVDLWELAQTEMITLVQEHLPELLSGTIPRIPQDFAAGTFHSASELGPAATIDLEKSYVARDMINRIRGLSGFDSQGATFTDNGQRYRIQLSIKKEGDDPEG